MLYNENYTCQELFIKKRRNRKRETDGLKRAKERGQKKAKMQRKMTEARKPAAK